MDCDHSGTYSGATRYLRHADQLRLVLVCDRCGAERGDFGNMDYVPQPTAIGDGPDATGDPKPLAA